MRIKLPVLSRVCGILFILLSISTFTTYGADRTHIDWLSSGFPKQITDQVTGLKLQFEYDRHERPYRIVSSDGETKRTWQYTYSATVRGGKAMAKVALPRVIKESGIGTKGLTTPKEYFGSKTKQEVKDALEKKYGPPKSSREYANTYYNDKTKRSYNVHEEPGHNDDKPHIDIRRRGGYEERKYDLKEGE